MKTLYHPKIEEISLPELLHALSDPGRLEIITKLATCKGRSCSDFKISLAKSTLSHHFKTLRYAGLIHVKTEGTQRIISIRKEEIDQRFPGLLEAIISAASQ